jgi:spermidine synthase
LSPRAFAPLLLACFALSGATSLTFEIVWTRLLGHVFGSTTLALSTVLAAFMAGLALGSALGGRVADRLRFDPLWAYAACEAGIAALALAIPPLVQGTPEANAWLWLRLGDAPTILALARFAICAGLLLAPTTLMGATLPILARVRVRTGADLDRAGGRVGGLYAVNTAGGMIGAYAAGFWGLYALGLRDLNGLAATGALAVAGLASLLALARRGATAAPAMAERAAPPDARDSVPPVVSPADARLVLVAYAASGALAMALEVLFFRSLALVLGSASQSYTLCSRCSCSA